MIKLDELDLVNKTKTDKSYMVVNFLKIKILYNSVTIKYCSKLTACVQNMLTL